MYKGKIKKVSKLTPVVLKQPVCIKLTAGMRYLLKIGEVTTLKKDTFLNYS
jgi:hypothetical protein